MNKPFWAAASITAITSTVPAAAAVLGDTVSCSVTAGNPQDANRTLQCDKPTATIGSGAEFQLNGGLGHDFDVDFSDKQLKISYLGNAPLNLNFSVLNFHDLTHSFDYLAFTSSYNVYDTTRTGITSFNTSRATLNAGDLMLDLRQTQFRPGATLVYAVPEATAWAMMIGGIGVIGFAMRSRKRTTARVTYA